MTRLDWEWEQVRCQTHGATTALLRRLRRKALGCVFDRRGQTVVPTLNEVWGIHVCFDPPINSMTKARCLPHKSGGRRLF